MLIELLTNKYPGMRFWLTQRLTALVMAVYSVLMVILLIIEQPAGYAAWRVFASPIWLRLLTIIFFLCLCMHAWLGVRDVLRDYIFNPTLRQYLQIAVDILLVLYWVWLVFILYEI
ncbi:MAG: succinate dehydrogenase, hydrophobic membrane anchor protein [Methylophilaceae bacterium]